MEHAKQPEMPGCKPLPGGNGIVARQEHDPPAAMTGRILVKRGCEQMVEALDQPSSGESLRDDPGRWLSSQFLRRHAEGIGYIDDSLSLPASSAFATSRCDPKWTARKMTSALTASTGWRPTLRFAGDSPYHARLWRRRRRLNDRMVQEQEALAGITVWSRIAPWLYWERGAGLARPP